MTENLEKHVVECSGAAELKTTLQLLKGIEMIIIIRIVIAAILLGHGIGHIVGFLGSWTQWQPFQEPAFNDEPWIFSDDVLIHSVIGRLFGIFWLLATISFTAAAIGLVANQRWWNTVAVIGSSFSLLAVLPWWNTFTPGIMSKSSAVLVDIIALVALLGPWKEVLLDRISSG